LSKTKTYCKTVVVQIRQFPFEKLGKGESFGIVVVHDEVVMLIDGQEVVATVQNFELDLFAHFGAGHAVVTTVDNVLGSFKVRVWPLYENFL